MKLVLVAFTMMTFLGCASTPTASTTASSGVTAPTGVRERIASLDKGINTILGQYKNTEKKEANIKLAGELVNIATSLNTSERPDLKNEPAEYQDEIQKEYLTTLGFIAKDLQEYADALKVNDIEIAKESVFRAGQTVKLLTGSAPSGD